MFDPTTLGTGTAVVSYAAPIAATPSQYGYETNAAGLAGRPAVVDSPIGAGHAVMLGFNPFYRAWKEQDERLVLNAALYPNGAEIAPVPRRRRRPRRPVPSTSITPAAAPVPEAQAAQRDKVGPAGRPKADRDVPDPRQARRRREAEGGRQGGQAEQVRAREGALHDDQDDRHAGRQGRAHDDEHARQAWVSRIQDGLAKRKVTRSTALV